VEKRSMWRREMDCLLSVCDYIVEFFPSKQILPDGTAREVMATRPRSDIYVNLPALEKLDDMLLVRSKFLPWRFPRTSRDGFQELLFM
jgi:hypothetical protein